MTHTEILTNTDGTHRKRQVGVTPEAVSVRIFARASEEQRIAICVFQLEAAQPVMSIFKRHRKFHAARSELRRQRIRIRHIHVSVPSRRYLRSAARTVRQWLRTHRLEEDHRAIALHNRKKWIAIRLLMFDPKAEHIAIKRNCSCHISHNKGRRNTSNRSLCHVSLHFKSNALVQLNITRLGIAKLRHISDLTDSFEKLACTHPLPCFRKCGK